MRGYIGAFSGAKAKSISLRCPIYEPVLSHSYIRPDVMALSNKSASLESADSALANTQAGHSPDNPAPLYGSIRELFSHGFKIDWATMGYVSVTHLLCLIATPFAYIYAPAGLWQVMLGWSLLQAFIGCLSTTVYSHRLIAHGAARSVSWPVHIVFGFIGQILAMQGSVRRWAALHVVHHGIDRTGQHQHDPYSATWFSSAWRNFLWSHMLSHLFHHPQSEPKERAFKAKNHPALVWQDRLYVPLLVLWNHLFPLAVGFYLAGWVGALCLQVAAIGGFILAQHNTWTVNSVTHMWGFTRGIYSSAKNNFIWFGPLGEGNHHGDHHDFGRDYRNGFGWSGWLLDPTRYVILLLNGLGLVRGLRRASKEQEANIVALRQLRKAQAGVQKRLWDSWEERLDGLRGEWLEAAKRWEAFKAQKLQLQSLSLSKLELESRMDKLKADMQAAKHQMRARKEAFFAGLYEMRAAQYAI